LCLFLLTSCEVQIVKREPVATLDGIEYYDWNQYYDAKLSKMVSPVILIGKDNTFGSWGITVKDKTGEVISIGNLVSTANNIGAVRHIGDTIK
jgi:hypothetical protein